MGASVRVQDAAAQPTPARERAGVEHAGVRSASVVAVIVTWNRRGDVMALLDRLAAQRESCGALHVVVVDNASTDGTGQAVMSTHRPERLIGPSPDSDRHEADDPAGNRLGVASLTLVRHTENLGGCGGFNAGFAAVSSCFGPPGSAQGPAFVWLLDDDVDLPGDTLSRLLAAAATDLRIALVGSRTVDRGDRRTTIESTIYYDQTQGAMAPTPPAGHPLAAQHARQDGLHGLVDVDVVSACSMLVRWAAVQGVGFWDERFFLYCDDAEWCLRVKTAGGRVVCALDAVVFHTPWKDKLTPVRGYYLHRNLLWMNRKHLEGAVLRRVTARWCVRLLRQARSAALNRRMTEADLTLRSLRDSMSGRGGRLGVTPDVRGVLESFAACGATPGRVALVAGDRRALRAVEQVRADVTNALIAQGRPGDQPLWTLVIPEPLAVAEHGGDPPRDGPHRVRVVRYRPTRLGKLWAQARFWWRRPDLVVQAGAADFPLLVGAPTLHAGEPSTLERGGGMALLRFAWTWALTAVRCVWHTATIQRDGAGR
jgi:GT2 family glycosyltransferase